MRILNFGSCNLDYVYQLDHIVTPGETETSFSSETFCGGKGLNQSVAAARAGAEVFHAGCLGEDGEVLRRVLEESGVDTSYLQKVEGKTGHAVIQVAKTGENCIFIFPGSNGKITEEQIDATLAAFGEGDFLVLQNEVNGVPSMVKKAAEKGMKIVLNPSPFNEKISEIDFSALSYLILNEVEAAALSGCENPKEALAELRRRYPRLSVLLTVGTKGCLFDGGKGVLYHPAFRVKAVDTTAAGDTFTGYFLACLAEGRPVAEGLKIASAASGLAVTRPGASPSIPFRDEVDEAISTLIPREPTVF